MKRASVFCVAAMACTTPTAVVIEPLRIINQAPSHGADCIDIDSDVLITFSHDLDPESLPGIELLAAGGPVTVTTEYDPQTFTVRLTPAAPMAYATLYTVSISAEVRAIEAGTLPKLVEGSFQTRDRVGCVQNIACTMPSQCPDPQVCANIGVCVPECVTSRDCYRAECRQGSCVVLAGD